VENLTSLEPVRERVAAFAGREAGEFHQILAIEYAHGAAIGLHRDKPEFIVVGVSLAAPAVLRLRRRVGDRWERASQLVEPRSAYMLSGEVRHDWEHSIVEQDVLRYSRAFRTLANQHRGA
jgi:alkylated DNA repair dioxygenase AlkB